MFRVCGGKKVRMKGSLEKFKRIIDGLIESRGENKQECRWLSGIRDMLSSKIYTDQLIADINFFIRNFGEDQRDVLELGAGCGIVGFLLSEQGFNVLAYDVPNFLLDDALHKEMSSQQDDIFQVLNKVRTQGSLSLAFFNGAEIPEKESAFDVAVLYAVVEHVSPPEKLDYLFAEIARVLRLEGWLSIGRLPRTMSYAEFIQRKFLGVGHKRLYRKENFVSYLKKFNFNVVASDSYEIVPAFPIKYTNRMYFLLKVLNHVLDFYPMNLLNHDLRFLATLESKELSPQVEKGLQFNPSWRSMSISQGNA